MYIFKINIIGFFLFCIVPAQNLFSQSAEWSWQYPPYQSGINLYDIHVFDDNEFIAVGDSWSLQYFNHKIWFTSVQFLDRIRVLLLGNRAFYTIQKMGVKYGKKSI
jgi:hypothetical protein